MTGVGRPALPIVVHFDSEAETLAGDRQGEGARLGMTHVVGLGSSCAVDIVEWV
jgi:hypothetical protein